MKLQPKFMAVALAAMITAVSAPFDGFTANSADTDVCINEICSQNKASLADSYGVYSDWIELYNPGDTAVDLTGYGLSDKADKPMQWVFPEGTTIAPKTYMIVFASKQASTASELHTGFALSKNGETLILSNPQGEILQQVIVPTLAEDESYGRTPDGGSNFEVMSATPAEANEIVVSAPVFSAESGFYGTDFSLSLSSYNNEAIYYTVDGSDPTTSPTAQLYTSAITVQDRTNQANIYSAYAEDDNSPQSICRGVGYRAPTFLVDKATVVRAAAKNENGIYSSVTNGTYFVTNGNLAKYQNMTVVSLVTNPDNLFDPDKGIYVTGNQYLNWKNSSEYNPNKSVWDTDNVTNYFSKGRDWEREASITIFEQGNSIVSQNMGIRIKGASTRNSSQKSFNLYARSEYGASKIEYPLLADNYDINGNLIEKYDSICLRSVNSEERLRDGFAQGLIRDRDTITTQNMKQCVVFLNGEYWGLYEMTEKFSDYFIESNYGIQKENVAMIKNGELEEGEQTEFDTFVSFAEEYSTKDLTDAANYQAVCDYIDIDSMIEHYAAGLYLGTYDWPNYNYGAWRNTGEEIAGNPYSDGKWRFISFDYDYTMGKTYADFGGVKGYEYDSFNHMDTTSFPTNLFKNLLNNDEFRNKFAAVYCDYANEIMTYKKANERASYYSDNYTDSIAYSLLRWWGFYGGSVDSNLSYNRNSYQSALSDIRTFFNQRGEYTLEDMKNYLGLNGSLKTITIRTNGGGKVKINSITPDLTNAWIGKYYSDCPITLTAIPDEGYEFTGWSDDLSGTENTVTLTLSQVMSVQANFEEGAVRGDVNADGEFNVSDLVMMQKWIVCSGELNNWQAGDLCEDGIINSFDLAVMKKELNENN